MRRAGWGFDHGFLVFAGLADEGAELLGIGLRFDAYPALEGVVVGVSYLGGLTVYKVKLDSGAVVRSSMANTARLDIDAYSASQRVVVWFTPDDCVVLEQ